MTDKTTDLGITSVLQEKRVFPPPKDFSQRAHIKSLAQYRRLYDDNGNFKPNVGSRPLRGEIDTKSRDQFAAENPEIMVEDNSGE